MFRQDTEMDNKYELIANLNNATKQIYEKYFKKEKYHILVNEEGVLFAKKINNSNVNLEHEKIIIDLIKSMIKQYKAKGILYINLTQEISSIMKEIKNEKNIESTDNRISRPIKKAIEKAILLKEKQKIKLKNYAMIKNCNKKFD